MSIIKLTAGGIGGNLPSQFTPIYNALRDGVFKTGTIIDLSQEKFLKPLTILPLAALAEQHRCQFILPEDSSAHSYLNTISFPKGVSTILSPRGSYVPVGRICVADPAGAERLTDAFEKLILSQLGPLPEGGKAAISYSIGEITTNILEHSKQEMGWMLGQFYEKKGYLDICILDSGRGLSRSYKEELNIELNDTEALVHALKGRSSKASAERGFGLWTTKRMITEGLGGECLILSGNAGYFSSPGSEVQIDLDGARWEGVLVAFRIPKITEPIDVTKYYE